MADRPAQPSRERAQRERRYAESGPEYESLITAAVQRGIRRYIESRRRKVPAFVDTHFSFRGAVKLHRKALGKDLYKAPANVLWALPALVLRGVSWVSDKLGAATLKRTLSRVPSGFETDVQKEINWLIYTELLELPYAQGDRSSEKDALLESILSDPDLAGLIGHYLDEIDAKSRDPAFREALARNLEEYAIGRTAAAELAGNLLSLASGYVAFHQATPGAIATGSAAAAAIAQHLAISNFWLGTTVGSWYYAVFPAAASAGLVVAATASVMAALAVVTTFTGIVTDPLQAKLGLHQKRLLRLLDAFEGKLLGSGGTEFRIKDQYIARVFDLLDLLRLAVRAAG